MFITLVGVHLLTYQINAHANVRLAPASDREDLGLSKFDYID